MENIIIEEQELVKQNPQEDEINLLDIVKRLWQKRKLIMIWSAVGILLGLIVAFSIPKEFTTDIKLAPESSDSNSSRNLGALAAIAGVNLGSASERDAVYPQLYPDIVHSVPFSLDLLNIALTDKSGTKHFTFEEYLENDMRSPWWNAIIGAPGKLISALRPESDTSGVNNPVGDDTNQPIRISDKQYRLINKINKAVSITVEQKTSVVTINVTLQDPVVSAIVADSVADRLKEYVTDYRTNKARQDMLYIAKLNEDARAAYYNAQQKYANYLDTHQGIVLYSAQTMRDRLENEATLAFNIFNQTSQQLQLAKAKVQEQTPVYATIEPATIPINPSAPRKALILVGFVFLAFLGGCAWVLLVQPFKEKLKNNGAESGSTDTVIKKVESEIIIKED